MIIDKIIKVPVEIKRNGIIITKSKLNFKQSKVLSPEFIICDKCSFNNICDKLPNPERLDKKNETFQDFCVELGIHYGKISKCNSGIELSSNSELFPMKESLKKLRKLLKKSI